MATINTLALSTYIACLITWGWVGIIYFVTYADSDLFKKIMPEDSVQQPVWIDNANNSGGSSVVITILAVLLAIIFISVLVYSLLKLPSSIGRSGQKITKATARTFVSKVTNNKPVSYTQKSHMKKRSVFYIKLFLIILPLIIILLSYWINLSLDYSLAVLTTAFLATIALILLIIENILAKILNVDKDSTW